MAHDILNLIEATESVNMPDPTFASFACTSFGTSENGRKRFADYVLPSGDPREDLTVQLRINTDPQADGWTRYSVRVVARSVVTDADGNTISDIPAEGVIAFSYPTSHPYNADLVRKLIGLPYALTYASVTTGTPDDTVLDKMGSGIPTILG